MGANGRAAAPLPPHGAAVALGTGTDPDLPSGGRRSAGLPPGSLRPPAPLLVTPARSPPPAVPTPPREPAAPRQRRAAAGGGGSRRGGGFGSPAQRRCLPAALSPAHLRALPGEAAPFPALAVPGGPRRRLGARRARRPVEALSRAPTARERRLQPSRPAAVPSRSPGANIAPALAAPGGEEPRPAGADLKVKERGTNKT